MYSVRAVREDLGLQARRGLALVLTVLAALPVVAAPAAPATDDVARARQVFQQKGQAIQQAREAAQDEALAAYRKGLDALRLAGREKGDLDAVQKVDAEIARLGRQKRLPPAAPPPALAEVGRLAAAGRAAQDKAEVDAAQQTVLLDEQYLAFLDQAVKQAVREDRLEAAKAHRQEMNEVRQSADYQAARFVLAERQSSTPGVKPAPGPGPESEFKPAQEPEVVYKRGVYHDRTAFLAAVRNPVTIDFGEIPGTANSPTGLAVKGVLFTTPRQSGPLTVMPAIRTIHGAESEGAALKGPAKSPLRAALPPGVHAVGFQIATASEDGSEPTDSVRVTLSSGETFNLTTMRKPKVAFFGLVSQGEIASVRFDSVTGRHTPLVSGFTYDTPSESR